MNDWTSSETLAWSRRDGLTSSPGGPPGWMLGSIALSMCGVWVGLIATDALCPDHRMWVQGFATAALGLSGASIYGLLTHRSWAPIAALGSALFGVLIGFLDAVHSATRGALISLAFAVIAVALLVAMVPQLRSLLWARRSRRYLATSADGSTASVEPARAATGTTSLPVAPVDADDGVESQRARPAAPRSGG